MMAAQFGSLARISHRRLKVNDSRAWRPFVFHSAARTKKTVSIWP
jgi:alkanesulfonate monooxygenase SsuD/methylene tetrahydromethanopterin reductase-like flavin-dependent oxidoreductase (luciferase family)